MISMKDIAKELNISRTTVSNILNNKFEEYSYKQETIAKVIAKAKEMGYIPNNVATSLKTGETNTIAVVVPDIANDFYINIIKELEKLTNDINYNLVICITEESIEKENNYFKMLKSHMINGVLIAPVSYKDSLKNNNDFLKIVCFDRTVDGDKYPYVSIDNYNAGKKLTAKLLESSSTNPLFLAGSELDITNVYRLKGYRDALLEKGIQYNKENVIYGVFDDESAFEKINEFLKDKKGNCFDSVFLSSNYSIYGVLKSLSLNNMEGIPIGGFENFKGSEFIQTKIHRVQQPDKKIAQLAFEKLLVLLKGENVTNTVLKTKIK